MDIKAEITKRIYDFNLTYKCQPYGIVLGLIEYASFLSKFKQTQLIAEGKDKTGASTTDNVDYLGIPVLVTDTPGIQLVGGGKVYGMKVIESIKKGMQLTQGG